ncbi:MAG: response regulator [Bdellovibrionota bacterium]
MKIFVVDDSKAVHRLLEEMLNEFSQINLEHSYNGREAVDAVTSNCFEADMILLDWEMPELTGIEALPELKKCCSKRPIIMMTSKNSMADITEALTKGATDYMMKPFTKDILLGKIKLATGEDLQ